MQRQIITDTIKDIASKGGSIGFKFETLTIPLKLADKKAIEILEMLADDPELKGMTYADFHEILDFAKYWAEMIQVLEYNDEPRVPDRMFGIKEAVE